MILEREVFGRVICWRGRAVLCCVLVGLLGGVLSEKAVAVEFSGQYSTLLFQTRDSAGHNRITDLNRMRLKLDAEQGAWRVHLAYDHESWWGSMVADPVLATGLYQPDATFLDASATLVQHPQFNWQHKLYRGWLAYDTDVLSVKLGRQRIAWGSGRIWNPTDRFNPVLPTALELQQKLGVDAALGQWNYSDSAYLLAVIAPARMAYRTSRKSAVRWQDTWGEFDVAMMLGRIGNEDMLGLDVAGNLADAGVHVEWMQAKNRREGDYGQITAGLDYTWNNRWFSNGLYTAIEYFYNGAAGMLFNPDRLNGFSHHLLGAQLAYDLTPLWRAELLLIDDVQYSSWFVAPSLTWSMAEDIDLQCFVQWPKGHAMGEFGRLESLYAVRLDWYF